MVLETVKEEECKDKEPTTPLRSLSVQTPGPETCLGPLEPLKPRVVTALRPVQKTGVVGELRFRPGRRTPPPSPSRVPEVGRHPCGLKESVKVQRPQVERKEPRPEPESQAVSSRPPPPSLRHTELFQEESFEGRSPEQKKEVLFPLDVVLSSPLREL